MRAGTVIDRELTEPNRERPAPSGGGATTEVIHMAEEVTTRRTVSRSRGGEGASSSKNRAQENGSHPGGGRTKRGEQRGQAEKPGGAAGKGNRQGQRGQGQGRQGGVLTRSVQGVKNASSTAVDAVKQNPVPAALIGAGLAWLIAESAAERYPQVGSVGNTVAKGAKNAASSVGEGVSTATGAVKNALSTTAETVKEGASTVGEYTISGLSTVGSAIGSGVSTVGRGTKKGLTATKEAVVNSWQNHPVITSAAALAAGIALAMMVPSTGPERKAMGKRSAATTGRAKSAAKEFL